MTMRALRHCTANVPVAVRVCVYVLPERRATKTEQQIKLNLKPTMTTTTAQTHGISAMSLARWQWHEMSALSNLNSNQKRRVHRKIVCHCVGTTCTIQAVIFAHNFVSVVDFCPAEAHYLPQFLARRSENFPGRGYRKARAQLSIHPFSFTFIDGFHSLASFCAHFMANSLLRHIRFAFESRAKTTDR